MEIVEEIGDRKRQEESWPIGKDNINSAVEMYCELFDDFLFDDFLREKENNLTTEQVELGRRLIKAMEEYSPSRVEILQEDYMLKDPRWEAVRRVARDFLHSLHK